MDPLAFRDQYRTAATVTATRMSGTDALGAVWSLEVKDSGGATLGTPQPISAIGGIPGNAAGAAGARLLDLEVIARPWTSGGDGIATAPARSERA